MKKRRRKKVRRIAFTMMNIAIPLAVILFVWTYSAEGEGRALPDYSKEDISGYLQKHNLKDEDYVFLFKQTGLTRVGIDALRESGRSKDLLAVQERFFQKNEVVCERNFLIFREMIKREEAPGRRVSMADDVKTAFPVLEDGDILLTFSSRFLGWRNGHAALVVDAEKGLTLEARTLGRDSAILSLRGWLDRPSFAVLRLRGVSKEDRAVIADYAKRNLVDLPYRLTAGMWGRDVKSLKRSLQSEGEALGGTQCAHLIWCAYNHFGYDLDANGGVLVTPKDLYNSTLLEFVQVYGMKIE